MWRSDPQTPVASTRTIASSGASSSGSGRSSTVTSPGAWKVTARTAPAASLLAEPTLERARKRFVDAIQIYSRRVEQILIGDATERAHDPDSDCLGIDIRPHLALVHASRDPGRAERPEVAMQARILARQVLTGPEGLEHQHVEEPVGLGLAGQKCAMRVERATHR